MSTHAKSAKIKTGAISDTRSCFQASLRLTAISGPRKIEFLIVSEMCCGKKLKRGANKEIVVCRGRAYKKERKGEAFYR